MGVIRNIGFFATACKSLIATHLSPIAIAKGQGFLEKTYRTMARDGQCAELITSSHPDPKIAAVGKAFEEILQKPLVKKFLTRKPKLYLDKTETFLPKGAQGISTPVVRTNRLVVIPKSAMDLLDPEELEGVIGHEIGHLIAGDKHPRRGLNLLFPAGRGMEKMADEVGAVLSGNPETLKTALQKMHKRAEAITGNAVATTNSWQNRLQNWVARRHRTNGSDLYESLDGRMARIDRVIDQVATPEVRQHVEAELARRLDTKHRSLFSHLYARPKGVSRGEA